MCVCVCVCYGDATGIVFATPLEGRRHTAYFRHRFQTEKEHRNLVLLCQRDDGLIVYLNDKEVARDNMKDGAESYTLAARGPIGPQDETELVQIPLDLEFLPPGDHVLAISLHNSGPRSTDLRLAEISLVEAEDVQASSTMFLPDRPAGLDPKQVDLSDHYNADLHGGGGWTTVPGGHNLANLPATFKRRHGVAFDLRGILQLESGTLPAKWGFPAGTLNERYGSDFQERIEGIAVGQTTAAIHFLTSCQWGLGGEDGATLARFVMHYEDGTDDEMLVQLGADGVRDWIEHVEGLRIDDRVVGWRGPTPAGKVGALSELIWKNPHPEKVIKTIDFVSELSPHGAPFLVAITLE